MGIFNGIEHVAAEGTSSSRLYFEPGNYKVTLESVFVYERRLGKGKLFIVETTVDESNNPNVQIGERRNWVQSFILDSTLPRVKAFIGTAMGFSPQQIDANLTAELCDKAVSPENPLRGKRMTLACTAKTSQNGKQFISHIWGLNEER